MKSTVSSKGQITVPKSVRVRYAFDPGTEVEFELREDGALLRRKKSERHPIWDAIGIGRRNWPKAFPRDVDAYIDWIRGGPYERGKRGKTVRRKR